MAYVKWMKARSGDFGFFLSGKVGNWNFSENSGGWCVCPNMTTQSSTASIDFSKPARSEKSTLQRQLLNTTQRKRGFATVPKN